MGTYDAFAPGRVIDGPSMVVPDDVLDVVRGLGGYTHPIFNDPDHVRDHTPFDAIPVPGTLLLFLAGGLAEQTDEFDQTTIALVGVDDARFDRPAFPGDELDLTMQVLDREPTSSGRTGRVRLRWTLRTSDQEQVCSAVATFLFQLT